MFWAGWYGDEELLWNFISKLNISPFIKIVKGQNVINACI